MKSAGNVLWLCLASKAGGKWGRHEGKQKHQKIEMESLLLHQGTILFWFFSD